MVVTALALTLSYAAERRIFTMPFITTVFVGIIGGLTLWLNDETCIKMKPTIIQTIFGSVLIAGLLANRLFLKSLMGYVACPRLNCWGAPGHDRINFRHVSYELPALSGAFCWIEMVGAVLRARRF